MTDNRDQKGKMLDHKNLKGWPSEKERTSTSQTTKTGWLADGAGISPKDWRD